VLSDNGMVFTTRFAGGRAGRDTLNGFQAELRDLGVTQKHSRPNHPTTCGKVERFHQTLKKWLQVQPRQPQTLAELQTLCDSFVDYYNTRRPHRSLNRSTPAAASTKPDPKPPRLAQHQPSRKPASVTMWSTPAAPSPSATQADSTTSESAEPTPEPPS
jgi:transposase InsO family protein